MAAWAALRMLPAGATTLFIGATAPDHWAFLNGQYLDRDEWAELFALWGTTFGSTSGDNFRVPDLSGRIPMGGEASGTVAVGATAGSATAQHSHGAGTLAAASHTHGPGTLAADSHSHGSGTLAAASHTHGPGSFVATHDHGLEGTALLGAGLLGGSISEESPPVTGTSGASAPSVTGLTGSSGATVSGATGSASASVAGATDDASPSIIPPVFGVNFIVYGGINGGVAP